MAPVKQGDIKYFLYARKSSESEDKQVASIDSQIDELTRLAKQRDLEILKVYSEAQSAKEPGRPVFDEMLNAVQGGKAQGIICWKLDRLARNPIDGGRISWMLQQGSIQHIQTFERSYYPGDNVLMMSVEFGMANQFIRDLSVNTKRGLRAKAERGWYPAPASLGYMNHPFKRKGEKEIIKDPEKFDLVRKMFDLMLTGQYTAPKILKIATSEWGLHSRLGNKISESNIYRMFNDPFYYGSFEFPKNSGNWYKGQHEAMITEDEYEKIQVILGDKGKQRPHTKEFAYTGLIHCAECNSMITAEKKIKTQKNGNVHQYTYYHCTKKKNRACSQKNIRQEDLESQINAILGTIEIPPEFKEWAIDQLKTESRFEVEDRNKILANLQRDYNACVQRIDALIDMRAAGELNEEEFARKKSEFSKEKVRLQELLKDTDGRVDNWLEKAEQVFTFAESAPKRYASATLREKRNIVFVLGSNLLLKDNKLSIHVAAPLLLIEKAAKEVKRIHARLEPLKKPMDKRVLAKSYSNFVTRLPV